MVADHNIQSRRALTGTLYCCVSFSDLLKHRNQSLIH